MRADRLGAEPRWFSPAPPGALLVITIVVITAVMTWLTVDAYNTPGQRSKADSLADWLAASALSDGIDPHTELTHLAAMYGVAYWPEEQGESRVSRNPRTPGALVLLYPLSLVGADSAMLTMLIVGSICVAAAHIVLSRLGNISYLALFSGLAYATTLGPARWSQMFGTHIPIILLSVAVSLVLVWDRDSIGAGIWLAVAATLRLFPLILLIALLTRKRIKATVAMLASMAVLNLTPLLLPHVTIESTLTALASTSTRWFDLPANISVAGLLDSVTPIGTAGIVLIGAVLVGFGLFVVRYGTSEMSADWALLLTVAILAIPIAWPQYLLALVPAVLLTIEETKLNRLEIALFAVAIGLTVMVRGTHLYTIGLVLLAGVLSQHALTDKSRSSKAMVSPITEGD